MGEICRDFKTCFSWIFQTCSAFVFSQFALAIFQTKLRFWNAFLGIRFSESKINFPFAFTQRASLILIILIISFIAKALIQKAGQGGIFVASVLGIAGSLTAIG